MGEHLSVLNGPVCLLEAVTAVGKLEITKVMTTSAGIVFVHADETRARQVDH